jgi:putative membrane protein
MKRFGLLSIALATAATMACNSNARTDRNANDTTVGTAGVADRNVSSGDKNFVQDMLADGNAEIQLAKLASDRAASPDVKRFAQMMIQDHTKAGDQLKQNAASYSIQPDQDKINDKQHDLMDKLSKLRGADFDREYMKAMVDDHQDAVDALEKHVDITTSGNTSDKVKGTFGSGKAEAERNGQVKPEKADNHSEASINTWAADTLPVVRHHLDEAKQINDKLQNTRRSAAVRHNAPHAKDARHPLGKARS